MMIMAIEQASARVSDFFPAELQKFYLLVDVTNVLVQVPLHVLDVQVEPSLQAMQQLCVWLALLDHSVLQFQQKIAPHAGQMHQSHANLFNLENALPIATACNSDKIQRRALAIICACMEEVPGLHQLHNLSAQSQILLLCRRFHVIMNPLYCALRVSQLLRAIPSCWTVNPHCHPNHLSKSAEALCKPALLRGGRLWAKPPSDGGKKIEATMAGSSYVGECLHHVGLPPWDVIGISMPCGNFLKSGCNLNYLHWSCSYCNTSGPAHEVVRNLRPLPLVS